MPEVARKAQNRVLLARRHLIFASLYKNVIETCHPLDTGCDSLLLLVSLPGVPQPHTVPSVIPCHLSGSPDSLTQGNFLQQVEVALKEVIANGSVKDEGHAVPAEFTIGLLPAGPKGKMGSQVGHGEAGQ